MSDASRTKIISFQSWVSCWDWYRYAVDNPRHVPHALVDRSPCQEPFFDPFAPSPDQRRPVLSGLCRGLRNFAVGQLYIYVTAIHPRVMRALGLSWRSHRTHYFGVAALTIDHVWPSHAEAERAFVPRRYVVYPLTTPHPPNLASQRRPAGAVARESCIVFDDDTGIPYTPAASTAALWQSHILQYHLRQRRWHLPAAACRIDTVDGREALQLTPQAAPVLTADDWEGDRLGMGGRFVDSDVAAAVRALIAHGGQ